MRGHRLLPERPDHTPTMLSIKVKLRVDEASQHCRWETRCRRRRMWPSPMRFLLFFDTRYRLHVTEGLSQATTGTGSSMITCRYAV